MDLTKLSAEQAYNRITKTLQLDRVNALISERESRIANIIKQNPQKNTTLSFNEQLQIYKDVVLAVDDYLGKTTNQVPQLELIQRNLLQKSLPITSTAGFITSSLVLFGSISVPNSIMICATTLGIAYLHHSKKMANIRANYNFTSNTILVPTNPRQDIVHAYLAHEYAHSRQPKIEGLSHILTRDWSEWLSEAHAYGVEKQIVHRFGKKLSRPSLTLEHSIDELYFLYDFQADILETKSGSLKTNFNDSYEEHKVGCIAAMLLEENYGPNIFRDMLQRKKLNYSF